MEKRLIALMVAGVITVGTMTGCTSNDVDSSIVRDNFFGDGRVGDEYIIIKQNDTHILLPLPEENSSSSPLLIL